jgi:hypothetical protein
MKPILCFALQIEAKPFIKLGNCKQVKQYKDIKYYKGSKFDCLVMGLGSVRAAAAIGWINGMLQTDVTFTNIGLCGSADKPLYGVYNIVKVTDNTTKKSFYPEVTLNTLPLANLITVAKPANAAQLAQMPNDLIDMEGYGFCKSASMFVNSAQIQLIKFVSDNGSEHFFNTLWQKPYLNAAEEILTNVFSNAENIYKLKTEYKFSVDHWLALVQEKLSLTFTQHAKLKDALKFAYNTKGAIFLNEIINQIPANINQKELKNKWVQNTINKLQHV